MKTESDPILQEVNRILFEMYGKFIPDWGKHCPQFCGSRCTCERKIHIGDRERIRREVEDKMRV